MLVKTTIWLFVLVGIVTAGWVAYSAYSASRRLDPLFRRYGESYEGRGGNVKLHDTYTVVGIGRWPCRIYPRIWATALIAIGMLFVIAGLVFILHVPHRHSA